MYYTY